MSQSTYVLYPVFVGDAGALEETERKAAAEEVEELFATWADRVQVRGAYVTTGFRADADLLFWWVATSPDDLQDLLIAFQRTAAGSILEVTWSFMGVHRPPEVAKDHVPAFMKGDGPLKYLNVYPFVRTPEWYLIPADERAALLRDHGGTGREFPGVLANTTSGFGLGDWEWILAFEADELTEIVDCIRALRNTDARRFTKEEIPFVTGIRKSVSEAIADVC